MNDNEQRRVADLSDWYLKEQLDFDKRMIRFRYQTIKRHLKGPRGLELGPAEGHMTQFLLQDFEQLTIVDGAADLLRLIPDAQTLVKVHALFESYEPSHLFDTVLMEHILEHVEDPVALLLRAKNWLLPAGRLLIGVPNAHSIHRLAAVKMGLLKDPCELNERDHQLGHRRVYTLAALRADVAAAGIDVVETGGVFLKPISNRQIQDTWTEAMIQGFYELGHDLPAYAAELYCVCQCS